MNKTAMIAALIANSLSGWSETDRPVLNAMADKQVENLHKAMLALNAVPDPKKVLVDNIIGTGTWQESDRALLMTMNEAQLGRLKPATAAPAAPAAAVTQPTTVTANQTGNIVAMTEEQFIAQAPAPMREMLTNGMLLQREEKTRLVGVILGNARNTFTKEYLESRSLAELRPMAALAQPEQTSTQFQGYNYAGQGGVGPTINEGEECLDMPSTEVVKK